jgi:hypothetical protein
VAGVVSGPVAFSSFTGSDEAWGSEDGDGLSVAGAASAAAPPASCFPFWIELRSMKLPNDFP